MKNESKDKVENINRGIESLEDIDMQEIKRFKENRDLKDYEITVKDTKLTKIEFVIGLCKIYFKYLRPKGVDVLSIILNNELELDVELDEEDEFGNIFN
jgi:hypothetical protein